MDALIPRPSADLADMHLADAPDYLTAIAAGIAHDLVPGEALKSAFGKWMQDHAEAIQTFGLANFYDGADAAKAMVNYSRLNQYMAIMLAEQGRRITELEARLEAVDAMLDTLTD